MNTGKWVREMKAQVIGATEIAKTLSLGRAGVYRVLNSDYHH
jgi:DNA invertase Pin-like site-specific DNA recombinase